AWSILQDSSLLEELLLKSAHPQMIRDEPRAQIRCAMKCVRTQIIDCNFGAVAIDDGCRRGRLGCNQVADETPDYTSACVLGLSSNGARVLEGAQGLLGSQSSFGRVVRTTTN